MYMVSIWCLITILLSINLTKQCSNSGYPFENYLSTITPYRIVSNKSFEQITYKGCAPQKIWMLVRHGTRNPSVSIIEGMKNRLPELKKNILENNTLPNEFIKNRDLDLFRNWKTKLDIDDGKKLAHEGEEEMLLLAERMQSRFPNIFHDIYSNTSYKFKYTRSQRTKKSAYYFVAGLFGRNTAKDVWFPESSPKDPILRFYKLCDKWTKEIKKNPNAAKERKTFEKNSHMADLVKKISERLNLHDILSTDDLILMYMACAFETAWNKNSKSAWCAPFTVDDLKVLEYAEDLKYYWQDGYGHEITYKQACPAFRDMINSLTSKDEFPHATVYFTHSGTLLKMLAHIGVYRESEHLKAQNYVKMHKRKWRTSVIDSFASNLAFVSFRCGSNNKILTLHQENIIRLPSCPHTDLCDVAKIKNFYDQSITSCDFNTMCTI